MQTGVGMILRNVSIYRGLLPAASPATTEFGKGLTMTIDNPKNGSISALAGSIHKKASLHDPKLTEPPPA
jgi:hypothetical protein